MEMFTQLVPLNETIYVGFQWKSYYKDKNKPTRKSIHLPFEAWTTFVSQAVPTLDNAIKEHNAKEPSPTETAASKKRPYSNGILSINILTFFNFRSVYISSSLYIYSSFVNYSSFNILNHGPNICHIVAEFLWCLV